MITVGEDIGHPDVAGAVTLAAIVWLRRRSETRLMGAGSWRSAVTLFVYAVFFSYAYVSLTAATGALILFGFVQATMIAAGFAAIALLGLCLGIRP